MQQYPNGPRGGVPPPRLVPGMPGPPTQTQQPFPKQTIPEYQPQPARLAQGVPPLQQGHTQAYPPVQSANVHSARPGLQNMPPAQRPVPGSLQANGAPLTHQTFRGNQPLGAQPVASQGAQGGTLGARPGFPPQGQQGPSSQFVPRQPARPPPQSSPSLQNGGTAQNLRRPIAGGSSMQSSRPASGSVQGASLQSRPQPLPYQAAPPRAGPPPSMGIRPSPAGMPQSQPAPLNPRPSPEVNVRPQPPSVQGMRPVPPGGAYPSATSNGYPTPSANGAPYNGVAGGGMSNTMPPTPGGPGGPGAPAPQAKLNPSMMPRPCAQEAPCGTPRSFHYRGIVGTTDASGVVIGAPPSNSDFIAVDDGSARIRYMRMTTGMVASDPNVMSRSGVPFACVLSPFADPVLGEAPVPVVDFTTAGGGGPLRCEQCNAYANPGFRFLNGGSQFQCNMCNHTNTTPAEHYSPITPGSGQRMDADSRHEFRYGSVEYIVGSADYCMRPPKPAKYVIAIDISSPVVASGLAGSVVASLKAALGAGILPGSKSGARVGLMTFDRALHYYDARGAENGRSVSVNVVPDVNESFIPLGGDAFFLTPQQAVAALDTVVEIHGLARSAADAQKQSNGTPSGAGGITRPECALGAALIAVKAALTPYGGKAFVVAGSLPSFGPGKLERRGGAVGGGESREMALLKEATPDYEVLGCEMADLQISVDMFLAPAASYMDAATLLKVPRACGGRSYLFSEYDSVRDAATLHRTLCAALGSVRAFEALLRVRTSTGVESSGEYVGHFGRPQRGDDVSGPVFDSTSALGLEFTVKAKLAASEGDSANSGGAYGAHMSGPSLSKDVCLQAATLFTDPSGVRRIRVHTVFVGKTTVLAEVFKSADVDAVATFIVKKAAGAVIGNGTPLSKARDVLIEKTAQALYVYRKHCTSAPLSGQLILPEALKVLPVMVLGLMKSIAFRPTSSSPQAGDTVSLDERVAALSFLTWASCCDVAAVAYPRMWPLHTMDAKAGLPLPRAANPVVSSADLNGSDQQALEPIAMPNSLLLSSEALEEDGVLLIENSLRLILWVGSKADPKLVNDLITQIAGGRLAVRAETAGAATLTKSVSDTGKRVAAIVQRVTSMRTSLTQAQVVIRQAPGVGLEAKCVMPMLVEDRPIGGGFSYVEFLRHVHKRVMDKLENESAQTEMQTWEMLNQGY